MKKPKKKRIKEQNEFLAKLSAIYSYSIDERRIAADKDEIDERINKIVNDGYKLFEQGKARGLIIASDEVTGYTMASGRYKTIEQLAEMIASFISSTKFNYGTDSLKLMELITQYYLKFDDRAEKDIANVVKKLNGWT